MSTDTIAKLDSGELCPAQYWIRHVEAWLEIAEASPLPEVEDFYRDLAHDAAILAEFCAQQNEFPVRVSLN